MKNKLVKISLYLITLVLILYSITWFALAYIIEQKLKEKLQLLKISESREIYISDIKLSGFPLKFNIEIYNPQVSFVGENPDNYSKDASAQPFIIEANPLSNVLSIILPREVISIQADDKIYTFKLQSEGEVKISLFNSLIKTLSDKPESLLAILDEISFQSKGAAVVIDNGIKLFDSEDLFIRFYRDTYRNEDARNFVFDLRNLTPTEDFFRILESNISSSDLYKNPQPIIEFFRANKANLFPLDFVIDVSANRYDFAPYGEAGAIAAFDGIIGVKNISLKSADIGFEIDADIKKIGGGVVPDGNMRLNLINYKNFVDISADYINAMAQSGAKQIGNENTVFAVQFYEVEDKGIADFIKFLQAIGTEISAGNDLFINFSSSQEEGVKIGDAKWNEVLQKYQNITLPYEALPKKLND